MFVNIYEILFPCKILVYKNREFCITFALMKSIFWDFENCIFCRHIGLINSALFGLRESFSYIMKKKQIFIDEKKKDEI